MAASGASPKTYESQIYFANGPQRSIQQPPQLPLQPKVDSQSLPWPASGRKVSYTPPYPQDHSQALPLPQHQPDLYYSPRPPIPTPAPLPVGYQYFIPLLGQAGPSPRQRTSIACMYCRRRKVRCSGYQSEGKCQRCASMNQECIFQPASFNNSTAFIPVSAVTGGVQNGTQLFGAYGQPLAASSPPPSAPFPPQPVPTQVIPPYYYQQQQVQSSTGPCSFFEDSRPDGLVVVRSRRETVEGHNWHGLAQPRGAGEEYPRRQFPGELSNKSTPERLNYPDAENSMKHNPQSPMSDMLLQPRAAKSFTPSAPDSCFSSSQNSPHVTPTIARQGLAKQNYQQPQQDQRSIMSLSSIIEKDDL